MYLLAGTKFLPYTWMCSYSNKYIDKIDLSTSLHLPFWKWPIHTYTSNKCKSKLKVKSNKTLFGLMSIPIYTFHISTGICVHLMCLIISYSMLNVHRERECAGMKGLECLESKPEFASEWESKREYIEKNIFQSVYAKIDILNGRALGNHK